MRTLLLALFIPIALTAGTLRIEGSSGDLTIESWGTESGAQPTIEVPLDVTATKQVSGDITTLTFTHKCATTCRIRVPRDTNLVIRHRTGAVTIYDITGDIDATAKVGDVILVLPAGGSPHINARVRFGGVTIQRLDLPPLVSLRKAS